jgi:hypothetical protein
MSRSEPEYARIPVKPHTRDELRGLKTGGETYDDVVRRMLSEREDASRTSDKPSEASSQRGE